MRKPGLEGLSSACPLPSSGVEQKDLAFLTGPCAPTEMPQRGWGQPHKHPTARLMSWPKGTLYLDYLQIRQSFCVELGNKSPLFWIEQVIHRDRTIELFSSSKLIYPCFTSLLFALWGQRFGHSCSAPSAGLKAAWPSQVCLSLHLLCFWPTHGWKVLSLHRSLHTWLMKIEEMCTLYVVTLTLRAK